MLLNNSAQRPGGTSTALDKATFRTVAQGRCAKLRPVQSFYPIDNPFRACDLVFLRSHLFECLENLGQSGIPCISPAVLYEIALCPRLGKQRRFEQLRDLEFLRHQLSRSRKSSLKTLDKAASRAFRRRFCTRSRFVHVGATMQRCNAASGLHYFQMPIGGMAATLPNPTI